MSTPTIAATRPDAQFTRRRRILDAAVELADTGGFDAVAMRTVAHRADVALGTLYRYFPSKSNLLSAALLRSVQMMETGWSARDLAHLPRPERVLCVLRMGNVVWDDTPRLAEAMTRARMNADSQTCPETRHVTEVITRMLREALSVDADAPTAAETATAEVLADLWLAGCVWLVTNYRTKSEFSASLESAVRLLVAAD